MFLVVRVHEEVGSYENHFLTYEYIVEFLKSVKLCHVDHLDVMFVESCRESECIFMQAFLCETHFVYALDPNPPIFILLDKGFQGFPFIGLHHL